MNIFSDWNILTGEDIKTIASNAPTTVNDLKALGILGEKKLEEYGARIVKPITRYVEKEGLEGQLGNRHQVKSSRANKTTDAALSDEIIEIADDDEDEFEDGIDYGAIDLG